jgi:hypothetical protein
VVLQKINPKSCLDKTQNKTLVVHLDQNDWQKLMPMSDYMRMAPSELGRVLLKQVLLQYQHREELTPAPATDGDQPTSDNSCTDRMEAL